ncbi:TolC family protein [Polaromonas sp.]|jgi:outer membrane protein TolC|uniref:TolC family protein n=1 Tax=Polaromonas sp. TaxID=1869339 RepID=UPI001D90530A|nr:TolC family protein [Polaromonas sp.]MBT9474891.1 TolC family protein [Polaromonas sp.]
MFLPFPISRGAAGVLISALIGVLGSPSWAADPLTLVEAQRIAVGRSQQLRAQDALAVAAREQAVSAGQLPDPVLKLGIDNLPANGSERLSLTRDFMTQRRIGLVQELTRAEKRQLRAERFERNAEQVRAQRQLTQANVQRETALAWLDRYYAQASRELLAQQIEEARLQVQAADIGFRTAQGSQADVFAARVAVIALEDRLSEVDRQYRSAGLRLVRWVGVAAAERAPSGAPPWQSTPLQNKFADQHLQRHPDLQVISAEIDAAETQARLAQANKQSDWSIEASYAQRGPAFSNMLSIGVSIPLQSDSKNRQDRELAAALALVDEARARYEEAMRRHVAEVSGWLNDWQSGKERVARYRDALIPTAQQRVEAALTSYRAGKSDLVTTLTARRDVIDVRIQALILEQETARSWAQLNFLVPDQGIAAQAKDQP